MEDLTFITFTSVFSLSPMVNMYYYDDKRGGVLVYLLAFEHPELLLTETLRMEFLIPLLITPREKRSPGEGLKLSD